MDRPRYTIRYRTVRHTKDYERMASPEYQVLDGRKVVGRFDFEYQAIAEIARLSQMQPTA